MKWIKSCHLLYSIQATKDGTEFCIANSKACWICKQLSFYSKYYCYETFSVRLKSKKYHHLGQVSAEQFKLESTQFSSFFTLQSVGLCTLKLESLKILHYSIQDMQQKKFIILNVGYLIVKQYCHSKINLTITIT